MAAAVEEVLGAFCATADAWDLDALVALHEIPLVVIGKLETKIYDNEADIRAMYERVCARFEMINGAYMKSTYAIHSAKPTNLSFAETTSRVFDSAGCEVTQFGLSYSVRAIDDRMRINLVAVETEEAAASPVLDCTIKPLDLTPVAA